MKTVSLTKWESVIDGSVVTALEFDDNHNDLAWFVPSLEFSAGKVWVNTIHGRKQLHQYDYVVKYDEHRFDVVDLNLLCEKFNRIELN